MTDCCTSTNSSPKRHICPVNKNAYSHVATPTILHHISNPWKWENNNQTYYFCDDPDCDVVYFGQDNSVVYKNQLRTKVGIKEKSKDTLVCYCFGVTSKEAEINLNVKEFVIKQTKEKTCACEARNPSGKCCLKDFPKP